MHAYNVKNEIQRAMSLVVVDIQYPLQPVASDARPILDNISNLVKMPYFHWTQARRIYTIASNLHNMANVA